ncbi:MAG: hypothetical protein AAF514_02215 [Verrucomicrobiota bacterium]
MAAEGYMTLGMMAEAHAELDAADAIPDCRMAVAILKLDCLIVEKRWKEAAIYGEALCDLDPDTPDYFLKYAKALTGLGQLEQAAFVLETGPEAIQLLPDFHYHVGRFEAEKGNAWNALHHIEMALAIQADFFQDSDEGRDPVIEPFLSGPSSEDGSEPEWVF